MNPLYVAPLAAWICWYKLVLAQATRSAEKFGPRWLCRLWLDAAWWLASVVMQMGFETNELETEKKGLLERPFMLVWHPHGAFAGFATMFVGDFFFRRSKPDHQWIGCVADVLFRFPFLSEFILLGGCRASSRATMDKLLAEGHTIAVQPGGTYEQARWSPTEEVAYFPKKLGFIRLAMKHGTPILPTYMFGENQMYRQNAVTRTVNRQIYNLTGVGIFFVVGRWGIPGPAFCMPVPTKGYLAFHDKLVEVGPKNDNPSDEKVEEVFRRYVAELHRLFDAHAGERLPAAVAKKGLKIVWRGHEELTSKL